MMMMTMMMMIVMMMMMKMMMMMMMMMMMTMMTAMTIVNVILNDHTEWWMMVMTRMCVLFDSNNSWRWFMRCFFSTGCVWPYTSFLPSTIVLPFSIDVVIILSLWIQIWMVFQRYIWFNKSNWIFCLSNARHSFKANTYIYLKCFMHTYQSIT